MAEVRLQAFDNARPGIVAQARVEWGLPYQLIAALLNESVDLTCNARFEDLTCSFTLNRCIKQGSKEAGMAVRA